MKLVWSILFGVGNILLVVYGAIGSSASFRLGTAAGLGHLAGATLPFLAMAVYVLWRGPRWVWMAALVLNALLMIGALVMGGLATFKPDDFGIIGPIAAAVGVIPLANLVYSIWDPPQRQAI